MATRDPLILGAQFALTAAAIAYSVHLMRQQKFKPANRLTGNRRSLKAPAYCWLAFGGLALWIALIVLSQMFPSKTPPDQILSAQLVFGTFAVLSMLFGSYCFCDVIWDDKVLSGPNWHENNSPYAGRISKTYFVSSVKEQYPQMSICSDRYLNEDWTRTRKNQ